MIVHARHYDVSPMHLRFTGAESQVLPFLPTNLTIEAIAEQIGRSRSTVKTHIAHIYEKLGVTTRGAAVDRARELGLLAESEVQTAKEPTKTTKER